MGPQHPHRSLVWWCSALGGGGKQTPGAHGPANLVKTVSFRFQWESLSQKIRWSNIELDTRYQPLAFTHVHTHVDTSVCDPHIQAHSKVAWDCCPQNNPVVKLLPSKVYTRAYSVLSVKNVDLFSTESENELTMVPAAATGCR